MASPVGAAHDHAFSIHTKDGNRVGAYCKVCIDVYVILNIVFVPAVYCDVLALNVLMPRNIM